MVAVETHSVWEAEETVQRIAQGCLSYGVRFEAPDSIRDFGSHAVLVWRHESGRMLEIHAGSGTVTILCRDGGVVADDRSDVDLPISHAGGHLTAAYLWWLRGPRAEAA